MVERARSNPKIHWLLNTVVEEILDVSQGSVSGIRVRNVRTREVQDLPADGVFVAIGHQPNTELFVGQLDLDEAGYLITDGVKTKIAGVYAAGDVQDPLYRQAITAAGTGCMAAQEARWFLLAHEEAERESNSTQIPQAAAKHAH